MGKEKKTNVICYSSLNTGYWVDQNNSKQVLMRDNGNGEPSLCQHADLTQKAKEGWVTSKRKTSYSPRQRQCMFLETIPQASCPRKPALNAYLLVEFECSPPAMTLLDGGQWTSQPPCLWLRQKGLLQMQSTVPANEAACSATPKGPVQTLIMANSASNSILTFL